MFSCGKDVITPEPILFSFTIKNVSQYGGNDGAIMLTVSGGVEPYRFLWSNGSITKDIDSLSAGDYNVVVTDMEKTKKTDTIRITQPDPDPITIHFTVRHVGIYDGSDGKIVTTVSGGSPPYSFMWSNGSTTQDLDSLKAGKYILEVSDQNQMAKVDSVSILQPDPTPIVLTSSVQHVSEYGKNDGSIELGVSGGVPPYTFLWSNGMITKNVDQLFQGIYSVLVSDGIGTEIKDTFQINQPDPRPIVLSFKINHVSAYGLQDASIEVTATGGVPPYSFKWSGGQTTKDIDHLGAGEYWLTVTDQLNVSQTGKAEVNQPDPIVVPDPLVLLAQVEHVSVYGRSDGEIKASVTGGTPPYQFVWSNGSTEKDLNCLSAGSYTLVVTDADQGSVTKTLTVSQPEENLISVEYDLTHPSETGAADGSIVLKTNGGFPPYQFLWSNGSEESSLYHLEAGEYTITVTDQREQSCTKTIVLLHNVIDVDGNVYSTVKIGGQTWMKENLRVTHAPDGSPIEFYVYQKNEENAKTYGRLYTWYVAMNHATTQEAQGICPCGWHIPSDEEFKILEMALGMSFSDANLVNAWRGDGVGTKLKSGGGSGYNALLSGRIVPPTSYSLLGSMEYVWTSTEYGDRYAWRRCLDNYSTQIGRWNTFSKAYGFSVRCIKNK